MDKFQTKKNPGFLDLVYSLNGDTELLEALALSLTAIDILDIAQLKRIGLKTYAKDKWSIHQIFQT